MDLRTIITFTEIDFETFEPMLGIAIKTSHKILARTSLKLELVNGTKPAATSKQATEILNALLAKEGELPLTDEEIAWYKLTKDY